ncbi:hypothetical protein ACFVYE_44595 [Streptomyces sp. NPDC058239]|uniref:hypothetical protein n=1 Tax=unclassified Streptomyces TaxID=2593676 RepID=UPI00364F18AD
MSQNVECPMPSQAKGERLEADLDPAEANHPATWRTQPSQAEGERLAGIPRAGRGGGRASAPRANP